MRKEDSSPQGQIVTEILQHLHACHNSVKVCVSKVGPDFRGYWLTCNFFNFFKRIFSNLIFSGFVPGNIPSTKMYSPSPDLKYSKRYF